MMNTKKKLNQIFASILLNSIYAMKNYPIMFINTLLSPLSMLVIIVIVSRGALIGVGIEGAFIMTMLSGGLSLQGDLSHLKNDFKLQDIVVSSPTTSFIYMIGMGLSELIYIIPTLIVLLILAILFIHATIVQALIMLIALIIIFLFSISLGFFLSTFTSDVMQSWGMTNVISTLLSTIPPVYYLITYIPMPFQYIAYISPTTYAAEILQSITGYLQITPLNFYVDWLVLIILTVIMLVLSIRKSRWREN